MTDELALKILAEIAAPGSGHLFSRRGAAAHAIDLIAQQAARIAELEAITTAKRGTSAQILMERDITTSSINGAMAFGYQNTNPPPSDDHWLAPFWKIGRTQAELEARSEPVAWLHTMHMEGGQTDERLSFSDSNPWGTSGLNYSEEYVVTTEPLYTAPIASGPRYDWSVSGMKQSDTGNWVLAGEADSAMAKDAERYRWLRNEHFPTADNPPLAQVVWKELDDRHGSLWANIIDGNDLDAAIDAAIAASAEKTGD